MSDLKTIDLPPVQVTVRLDEEARECVRDHMIRYNTKKWTPAILTLLKHGAVATAKGLKPLKNGAAPEFRRSRRAS